MSGAGKAFDGIDWTVNQQQITVKGSVLTARGFLFKLMHVLDGNLMP
jgi:hypothetical protein